LTEPLSSLDRALIAWECERLVRLYFNLSDAGDYNALAELYATGGAFARPTEPDKLIVGRETIRQFYLARPPRMTRHLCTNVVIEVDDTEHAHGQCYVLLYSAAPSDAPLPIPADPAPLVGAFHDRFVREEGVWKFAERRGSLAFRAGG
jgi:hypothetical protein